MYREQKSKRFFVKLFSSKKVCRSRAAPLRGLEQSSISGVSPTGRRTTNEKMNNPITIHTLVNRIMFATLVANSEHTRALLRQPMPKGEAKAPLFLRTHYPSAAENATGWGMWQLPADNGLPQISCIYYTTNTLAYQAKSIKKHALNERAFDNKLIPSCSEPQPEPLTDRVSL